MSQFDPDAVYTGATAPGSTFCPHVESALKAIVSSHSGDTAPTYAVAGTVWIDTTIAAVFEYKAYDGTDWITLGFWHVASNVFFVKPLYVYTLIPGNPPANTVAIYFDSAADQVKAKKSDGTMCVMGDFSP